MGKVLPDLKVQTIKNLKVTYLTSLGFSTGTKL